MYLRAAAIALGAAALLRSQVGTDRPLTVCQILSSRAAYSGRRVTVRGRLVVGPEGSYLMGDGCQPLVTDGYTWAATGIDVEAANSAPARSEHGSARPAEIAAADLERAPQAVPGGAIYVTLVGRFETRLHFQMILRGDGKTVPNGYGHLNSCPARMVYSEMKDVAAIPAKR